MDQINRARGLFQIDRLDCLLQITPESTWQSDKRIDREDVPIDHFYLRGVGLLFVDIAHAEMFLQEIKNLRFLKRFPQKIITAYPEDRGLVFLKSTSRNTNNDGTSCEL